MTKYLQKSFSVGAPGTDAYRENWERTFRGAGAYHRPWCAKPLDDSRACECEIDVDAAKPWQLSAWHSGVRPTLEMIHEDESMPAS